MIIIFFFLFFYRLLSSLSIRRNVLCFYNISLSVIRLRKDYESSRCNIHSILHAQNQSSRSSRSNDYHSGICMTVIEIGRREYRMVSPESIPLTVTTDSLVWVSAKLENKLSHHGGNGGDDGPPPDSNSFPFPSCPPCRHSTVWYWSACATSTEFHDGLKQKRGNCAVNGMKILLPRGNRITRKSIKKRYSLYKTFESLFR